MNKKIQIRTENTSDHQSVSELIKEAFLEEQHSDHQEHFLVERLRKSDSFIPELSIVAVIDDKIVGHILLTKAIIGDEHHSLIMAPVSVLPDCQSSGIGGALIAEAHRIALGMGYVSVVLLGHEGYYPRFGYRKMSELGLTMPFEAPEECCMVVELAKGGLDGVKGIVKMSDEFFV